MSSASKEAFPLEYADSIICSAVKHPSEYAQPNSPTECPIIPSGVIPKALNTSVRPICLTKLRLLKYYVKNEYC